MWEKVPSSPGEGRDTCECCRVTAGGFLNRERFGGVC